MSRYFNRFDPIRPLMDTDAYKLDHRRQYPVGTTGVLSNYTNRGTRIAHIDHVVQFGLQAFLESWAGEAWRDFFASSENEVASLYEEFTTSVLGPNTIGSDHIRALHRVGYLPLKFRALDEGTLVPLRVPSFTVENTLPEFYWLVNYIETVMSAYVWQPSTSATIAYYFRKLLDEWAIKTTGSTAGVEFQGHDFSFRGMPGVDAAAASGAGHLLSFLGSDNLNAINFVKDNYPSDDWDEGDTINGMILGSVPATEHSVMCAGATDAPRDENGKIDEINTYRRLLKEYPSGIVSAVSDTYDLWAVITSVLPRLKDEIMARDGKLVIRPDSGDPVDILTGTMTQAERNEFEGSEWTGPDGEAAPDADWAPSTKGVVELLWDIFGGTVVTGGDGKEYKVLDSHIGSIYGDSITYDRADEISRRLAAKGFASTNVVFGVGSFTYQYQTRDTFMSAIKATWVEINGTAYDIFKDPITDNGTKKSAKGRLAVVRKDDGDLHLLQGKDAEAVENTSANELKLVWEDGHFVQFSSFTDVRETLHPTE